ncbi:hypothetical protein MBLNU457_g0208t1 [Dothideomycetes sp. NU457]
MGKLIKNHWARLIILTAASYQIAAAVSGFFWPKIFFDFLTKNLDCAVKPVPILQVINLVMGLISLSYELPLGLLAGTRIQRSLEIRLFWFPLASLGSILLYQATNPAIYYLVGTAVYFWAYTSGEIICAEPWTLPRRPERLIIMEGDKQPSPPFASEDASPEVTRLTGTNAATSSKRAAQVTRLEGSKSSDPSVRSNPYLEFKASRMLDHSDDGDDDGRASKRRNDKNLPDMAFLQEKEDDDSPPRKRHIGRNMPRRSIEEEEEDEQGSPANPIQLEDGTDSLNGFIVDDTVEEDEQQSVASTEPPATTRKNKAAATSRQQSTATSTRTNLPPLLVYGPRTERYTADDVVRPPVDDDEQAFLCPKCPDRKFGRFRYIESHCDRIHKREVLIKYMVQGCRKTFASLGQLTFHETLTTVGGLKDGRSPERYKYSIRVSGLSS